MYVLFPATSRWQDRRMNDEVEASRSRCWAAVLDGLMTQTQVVRMELDEAESVADRVLEGLDRHRLTVIDRDLVAVDASRTHETRCSSRTAVTRHGGL